MKALASAQVKILGEEMKTKSQIQKVKQINEDKLKLQ
tara:strand:+ start:84 stop:194 length:111 start_codon:yes stop_codon:yes gene_type:complete